MKPLKVFPDRSPADLAPQLAEQAGTHPRPSSSCESQKKVTARTPRPPGGRYPPYLPERISPNVFLKSIHPQTRQLNFTIHCYKI